MFAWLLIILQLIAGGMGRAPRFPTQLAPIGAGGVIFGHMFRRRDEFGRAAICCIASLPPFLLGLGAVYLVQRREGNRQTQVQDFMRRIEAAKFRSTDKQVYFDAPFLWESVAADTPAGEIARFNHPNSNVTYLSVSIHSGGTTAPNAESLLQAARDAVVRRDPAATVRKAEIVTLGGRQAARIEVELPGSGQQSLVFHFPRDSEVVVFEYRAATGNLAAQLESFETSAKTIRLDAAGLVAGSGSRRATATSPISVPYFRELGAGQEIESGVTF